MRAGTDFDSFYNGLLPKDRDRVDSASEKVWGPVGTVICQQGDASEAVYIVEDGVVEVLVETTDHRPSPAIAYLSRGDVIGELGVLNNSPRTATIRAITDLFYRQIQRDDLFALLAEIPGFGLYIAHRLAERLANTTANLAYNSYCVDLSGKLPEFDLMTVFQTVRDSNQSGELRLVDRDKVTFASVAFTRGRVSAARFLHLAGTEALTQLFTEPLECTFSFEKGAAPKDPAREVGYMNLSVAEALLRAAVLRDEYVRLPEAIRNLDATASRTGAQFPPELNDNHHRAAAELWQLIERGPQDLRSIWRRSSHSALSIAQAAEALASAGCIEIITDS